jgi:hypothetical protein
MVDTSNALGLAYALIVTEDERPVFPQRSPAGGPKLIPLERRYRAAVKEVPGVERAISQELVHRSVKLVCPGARGRTDNAPRSPAVCAGVIAC